MDTQRVEEDDPHRCQAITTQGQCRLKAVEGGSYCLVHGGQHQIKSQEKAALKNYRLKQWQARVGEFSDSKEAKNIRDEIGILRLLLEERMNQCKDSHDLMLQSQAISRLVQDIEKTVTSCHRLETQLGQTMDKQALIQFASKVVTIVSEVLSILPDAQASELGNEIADRLLKEAVE